jgi:hypothetical protein
MKKKRMSLILDEGAGARAAIQAHDRGAKVLMVTKGRMARSGATITAGMDIDMDSRSAKNFTLNRKIPGGLFEDMVVEEIRQQPRRLSKYVRMLKRIGRLTGAWLWVSPRSGHRYPRGSTPRAGR